jgi:hypothetical protein
MEHTNTLCGQNAESYNVKTGGYYWNLYGLNGYLITFCFVCCVKADSLCIMLRCTCMARYLGNISVTKSPRM